MRFVDVGGEPTLQAPIGGAWERVNLRHADGGGERRVMTNRDEYASVLTDGFGLDLSDGELNTILAVRARHGVAGSSHPFFG